MFYSKATDAGMYQQENSTRLVQQDLHALATLHYTKEKPIKSGLSAVKIAQMYNKEYNINLSARMIQQYVKERPVHQLEACWPADEETRAMTRSSLGGNIQRACQSLC